MKKAIRSVLSVSAAGIMLIAVAACGSALDPRGPAITLKANEVVTFSENEAGGSENGWWDAESVGNWSQSDRPVLNLKYDDTFKNGMNIILSVSGFVVEKNPNISVSIRANEEFLKKIEFNLGKPGEEVALSVSKEILSKKKGIVTLAFEITNAAVPNDVGYNSDLRKLGILLRQIIATPAG